MSTLRDDHTTWFIDRLKYTEHKKTRRHGLRSYNICLTNSSPDSSLLEKDRGKSQAASEYSYLTAIQKAFCRHLLCSAQKGNT